MAPISSRTCSPIRIIEPFPNFFSMFAKADSIALPFASDTIATASFAMCVSPYLCVSFHNSEKSVTQKGAFVKCCCTYETNDFPKISGKIDFKLRKNDSLCQGKKQSIFRKTFG